MGYMSVSDTGTQFGLPAGRFWFTRWLWPHVRVSILGLFPVPGLGRQVPHAACGQEAGAAAHLADMDATSAQVAQLAMFRLLWLQRQTRRPVRGRHREAVRLLARPVWRRCCWACTAFANLRPSGSCTPPTSRRLVMPSCTSKASTSSRPRSSVKCAAELSDPGPSPKVCRWRKRSTMRTAIQPLVTSTIACTYRPPTSRCRLGRRPPLPESGHARVPCLLTLRATVQRIQASSRGSDRGGGAHDCQPRNLAGHVVQNLYARASCR